MTTPDTEGVEYRELSASDLKYERVMQIIRSSFLDPDYDACWTVTRIETVENRMLYDRFRAKREELNSVGHPTDEYDMFTCYKNEKTVRNIFKNGLHTAQLGSNFLGNSKDGVSLWRHADVELRAAENANQHECYLIICKVMLGKTLPVQPSATNQLLTPSNNFDSHISSLPVDRSMSLGQQAIRSQVFCYEYIDEKLSFCPRHVLPYVKVCYKRPPQLRRTLSDNLPESHMHQPNAPPDQRSGSKAHAVKSALDCVEENTLFTCSNNRSLLRPNEAPGSAYPPAFNAALVTWSGALTYQGPGQCQQASCALNIRSQPPVAETLLTNSTGHLRQNAWPASFEMNRPGVGYPESCYSANATSWHSPVLKPPYNTQSQALIPDKPPTDCEEFYYIRDFSGYKINQDPSSVTATQSYGSGVFVQLDTKSQLPVVNPNVNVTSGTIIVEPRNYIGNMRTTFNKQDIFQEPHLSAEWQNGVRWNLPVFGAVSSRNVSAGCACHESTPDRSQTTCGAYYGIKPQPQYGVICEELSLSPCHGESGNQYNEDNCTDVCRSTISEPCLTKRRLCNLVADKGTDTSPYHLPGTRPSKCVNSADANGKTVTPDSVVHSRVALSASSRKTPTRDNKARTRRPDRGRAKRGKSVKWNKDIPNFRQTNVKTNSSLRRLVWQTTRMFRFCQDGSISAYYYKEKKSTNTAKPKTRLTFDQQLSNIEKELLLECTKDCAATIEVEIDPVVGLHKSEDEDFRDCGVVIPTVNGAVGSASFSSQKEGGCAEAQRCDAPNSITTEAIEDCHPDLRISKVESLHCQMMQDFTNTSVRNIIPESVRDSFGADLAAWVTAAEEENGRSAVSRLTTKCSSDQDAEITYFSGCHARVTQQNHNESRAETKVNEKKITNYKILGSNGGGLVQRHLRIIESSSAPRVNSRTGKKQKLVRPAHKIPSAGRYAASKRLSRRYANWRKQWKKDRLRAR